MMPRIHLFEIEDQRFLPQYMRDYITDYLDFIMMMVKPYRSILPVITNGLSASGIDTIVDLGSGGGGGTISMHTSLTQKIPGLTILLTDLFPNMGAVNRLSALRNNKIKYLPNPVDATQVPSHIYGFRMMFRSFHHFKPTMCEKILQNAVKERTGIGIFEFQQRSLWFVLYFLVVNPLLVLLLTPFFRPFRWGRLFFTYILPFVPLATMWDATVSCLRTYTPEELRKMTLGLKDGHLYHWEADQTGKWPSKATYLVGIPRKDCNIGG